jgi:transcriptional regulator with XRE-family HTH domain
VEEKSHGRWKAVVVGSYERGDRSVTVQKLSELALFYGVPISELMPGDPALTAVPLSPRLVINLERMTQLPAGGADSLVRYVAAIQRQRNDYNGRVLTLRYEDLRALMVLYDMSAADLTDELIRWGVLDPDALSVVPE